MLARIRLQRVKQAGSRQGRGPVHSAHAVLIPGGQATAAARKTKILLWDGQSVLAH